MWFCLQSSPNLGNRVGGGVYYSYNSYWNGDIQTAQGSWYGAVEMVLPEQEAM